LTPLLSSYIGFVILIFVTGIALGFFQPLTLSLISISTPSEERGLGIGLRLMANRASHMLDPLLFGVFILWFGIAYAFWLIGLLLLILSIITIYLFYVPKPR